MNTHKLAILGIVAIVISHLAILHADGMVCGLGMGYVAGLGGYSAYSHFNGAHKKSGG